MASSKRGSPGDWPLVKAVELSGFKSVFSPTTVDLAPITLLAGANSSGKSSFMQALVLLKQTLEAQIDPGPLKLGGPNVHFSFADQFLSRISKGKEASAFKLGFTFDHPGSVQLTIGRGKEMPIEVREFVVEDEDSKVTLRPGMTSKEIEAQLPDGYKAQTPHGFKANEIEYYVEPSRFLLNYQARLKGGPDRLLAGGGRHLFTLRLMNFLSRFIHLPGLRGHPLRRYPLAAVGKAFPGLFGPEYTASIISAWQDAKGEDGKQKLTEVGTDLHDLGLTWKVAAKRVSDAEAELLVGRLQSSVRGGAHDLVNIADVGFGVSQVLPVVVALHIAEAEQTVYLEQPEIHLHPAAQVVLARVLARAIARGVRVIVETHSSSLLLALQTLVAEGAELNPDDVRLYWFTRDPKTGETQVSPASLDQEGAFGNWPVDFGKVELQLESRYLDALDARHGAK